MIEGIVWTKQKDGTWTQQDTWPAGRKSARIFADCGEPFGQYSKSEATALIEGWIANNKLPQYFKIGIIPGKEMSAEAKEKLIDFTRKKKIERGEMEPVESYISPEK